MNRLLLLFVLLISSFGLRAGPFLTNKIITDVNPINISISNFIGVNCDTMLVRITFTIDLPTDQLKSAVMNFDDGRGDFLLDSEALTKTLTFDAHYGSTGSKHITFRLLKTDGLYEEKSIDFTMSEFRDKLDVGPNLIYTDGPGTPLRVNGFWNSYLWSTGETAASIFAQTPGTYWVKVTASCGRTLTDTIVVKRLDPNMPCVNYLSVLSCDSVEYMLYDQSCVPGYFTDRWILSTMAKRDTLYGQSPRFKAKNNEFLHYEITCRDFTGGKRMKMEGTIMPHFSPSTFATEKIALKNEPVRLEDFFKGNYNTNMVTLDTTEPVSYRWSTGATTTGINVTQPGLYVQECGFERCFDKFKTNRSYQVDRAILKPIITPDEANKLSVTLTDSAQVSFYDQLSWSFGDGATATGREVTHTYSRAGTYNVQLTGISSTYPYNRDTKTISVRVGIAGLIVDLGPDKAICTGEVVSLRMSNTYTGATYRWSTGDTTYYLNVTEPGQYALEVVMDELIGSDTINVIRGCPAKARFQYYRRNNGQLTMQFVEMPAGDSMGITSRHWDFGDGSYSNEHNPAHTYDAPGNYQVRLWIEKSAIGQLDSTAQFINIMPPVKVQLGKDTTIAAGQSLRLDATEAIGFWHGDATYLWSTGDTSRAITVNKAGLYTLTVYMYGYVSSDSIRVSVNQPPAFNAGNDTSYTGSPMLFKINEPFYSDSSVTVTWYPGAIVARELLVSKPDTYYAYLTSNNYSAADTFRVYPPLNIDLGPDTTLTSASINLRINAPYFGDSTVKCVWYPGGISGQQITVQSPGVYTVVATRFGSESIDSITVREAPPKPTADFSYARANDGRYTLNFTAIPPAGINNITYSWQFGDGVTATGKNVSHTYSRPELHDVFLFATDSLQHIDTIRKSVYIVPFVSINLGADTTVDEGQPVHLDAIAAIGDIRPDSVKFLWSTGDTSSAITVTQPGSYTLSVSMYGLTNADSIRISNRFVPPLKAAYTFARANDGQLTMNFTAAPTPRAVKYTWDFGDNTADTGIIVSHTYQNAGRYGVILTVSDAGNAKDSMPQNVMLTAPIRIDLGPDTTYYGSPLTLRINEPYYTDSTVTVKWMPGNISGKQITVNTPGTYYATATQYGYSFTDTIIVRDGRPQQDPDFSYVRANDGAYTINFTGIPSTNIGNNATYYWRFGDGGYATGKHVSHTYTEPGLYNIFLYMYDSLHTDSIRRQIAIVPFVTVNLGPDTTLTPGSSILLDAIAAIGGTRPADVRFLWSTGDTTSFINVTQTGTYALSVSMYGRTVADTMVVAAVPVPPVVGGSAAVIAITDNIPVTYTFPHTFKPDNIFTVQLVQSDPATGGRAAEPEVININSFPGTDPRVSVNVKLPETIPCGKNYRIRVVSSSPADTSGWSQGFEVLNPPAVPILTQRGDTLESTVGYAYQWFRNNQPVAGATTRAIRAKVNGSYQVQVFSAGDCSTMSASLSMVITGLTDLSLTISKLSIYPNPSSGAVYVEVEKVPAKPVRAEVYNSKGVIIHTFLIKDKKTILDLSAQPRGLYYIVPRGADKQKASVVVIQ